MPDSGIILPSTVSSPNKPAKTLPIGDAESIAQSVRARLAARKPFLVVLSGADVGARFPIAGACTVGRDPSCDQVLRDERASKLHARFEVRDGEIFVVDLGSTNGTLLNEQRVTESALRAGDKIFVGSTVMRLDWQDAVDQDYHEELERLISVDELTGLMSKRRFDTEGGALVAAALHDGKPVTVLMMDLDGIKKINDTHGHAFGAYCIAEAGSVIGRIVGERGVATRWGGDEYSAVLPGLSSADGVLVGEEILAGIRGHTFVREGIRLEPGVSIGVASGPEQGMTHEDIQHRADEALYRAKRAGKNRVST